MQVPMPLRRAFVCVPLLSGLLAACGGSSAPAPGPSSAERMRAPVVVSVEPAGPTSPAGETELWVHVDVNEPLPFPLALTVVPPAGGALVAGAPRETLSAAQPGRQSRAIRVRTPGPLAPSDPVRVLLDGATPGAGLHAERRFPPAPATAWNGAGAQVAPPGGRPAGALPRTP
jgi:hypothetical protein